MLIKNFINAVKEVPEIKGYTGIKKVIFYAITPVLALYYLFWVSVYFIAYAIKDIKTTLGKD